MKRLAMSICILLSISAFAQPTEQITVSAQQDSIVYTVNGETSAIANTDMAAYYLSQGIASAIEGDYTGAESKFKVGLLYDLENAEILYNLGLAQYYLEKFEEAIKTFDAAADYDPENKDIYNQRGLCKARSGLLAGSRNGL
ncbi:MAG: tetratricopeptide repeat protein [Chitinophagaceae bacterium]